MGPEYRKKRIQDLDEKVRKPLDDLIRYLKSAGVL